MAGVGIGPSVQGSMSNASQALTQVKSISTSSQSLLKNAAQGVASAFRSMNLPTGGQVDTSSGNAQALFGTSDVDNDWRVRLSIPPIAGFSDSPVLEPLRNLGHMVFPYTPAIQLSHTANYNDVGVTHQNYQFSAYENSRVDNIIISAPFNVEDGKQALYWIAALHYFRSLTKMFTGEDGDAAGNPPPIVKLNGYGEYVFNNVPVIVKSFSLDLPQDADYIPANDSLLSAVPIVGQFFTNMKDSRVPTKSTLSVTLQPIYSRTAARYFSLTKFVSGGYVSTGGYV